jgi:hypothetical protein
MRRKCPPSPPWNLHSTIIKPLPDLHSSGAPNKRARRTTRSGHVEEMKKSASIAKDLLKLAIQMRKGIQLEAKDCYQQWRSMEAFVNHSTSESMQSRFKVPRMALPSTYVQKLTKEIKYKRKIYSKYIQGHTKLDDSILQTIRADIPRTFAASQTTNAETVSELLVEEEDTHTYKLYGTLVHTT